MTDRLTDTALIVGATMRLTRLIVTDDLGQWWVKDPLDRWMHEHGDPVAGTARNEAELNARVPGNRMRFHRYLSGLDCPYCVGFWIGAATLASYHIAKRVGLLGPWRYVAGALTLNEVAAHAGIMAGDF